MNRLNPFKPAAPAPPAFAKGKIVPQQNASLFSKLFYNWLNPFLSVGYSRPLQEDDLWNLPEHRRTSALTDIVESNFYKRCPPEKRSRYLQDESQQQENSGDSVTSSTGRDDTGKGKISESNITATAGTKSSKLTHNTAGKNPSTYDCSLFKALYRSFVVRWWTSGILLVFAETLRSTSPLVSKLFLTWLAEEYVFHQLTPEQKSEVNVLGIPDPKSVGYGVGLVLALFAMQEAASLMMNHYNFITMSNGLYIRTGIVGNMFRKSLRLSGLARSEHSVGEITTMISTDVTRLDEFCAFVHYLWVAPVQIVICIGLLVHNLGVSAVVGLGSLILALPIQAIFVVIIYKQRFKGVKITDKRIRLVSEVLQGIRLIKSYAWESFYAAQLATLRTREIQTVKATAIANAGLMASVTFAPVLAATLSFVTYALTGHDLNVAVVFSSLMLFGVIQAPLLILPVVLAAYADSIVAFRRITTFLLAEELPQPYLIQRDIPDAVVVDGDFTWEVVKLQQDGKYVLEGGNKDRKETLEEAVKRKKAEKAKQKKMEKEAKKVKGKKRKRSIGSSEEDEYSTSGIKDKDSLLPTTNLIELQELGKHSPEGKAEPDQISDEPDKPFELKGLKMRVPKGSFVAVVGRVGSGKSSILQALIGEMRKLKGEVLLGGSLAYVPQNAWIRNATLRENVIFGNEVDDERRFQNVVEACCLKKDIEVLPQGEHTEIGERGITLSGGQKARVSLARAAYSPSSIILLDDCLSAVDSHVGKSLLHNLILNGPLSDRTRILVTHRLDVLDKTDFVYVMDSGRIIEEGKYQDLMREGTVLQRILKEEYAKSEPSRILSLSTYAGPSSIPLDSITPAGPPTCDIKHSAKPAEAVQALMQEEDRETGAVSWSVYSGYLGHAGGVSWAPIMFGLMVITQAFVVGTSIFLGLWTNNSIQSFKMGDYIAVYVSLGLGQAFFAFSATWALFWMCLSASLSMFKAALNGVLRSPVSFFDTTPMGRVINRLSKDQDTLDTQLSTTMFVLLATVFSVFGTIFLVFYTFPLLGLIFIPLTVLYFVVLAYYRRSSVETKRLDSILRSRLYARYSETLTGVATIRAYNMQNSESRNASEALDAENRAYFMTIAIQRWLGVRMDLFANLLVLGLGLFAVGMRDKVNPSKIGVVLSYALNIAQVLSETVSQFAQNEQNMNAVERVLVYTTLPSEYSTTPSGAQGISPSEVALVNTSHVTAPEKITEPPANWPSQGRIEFKDVSLRYRDGLPLVLDGVTFSVNAGERVGIVGRTGAGKSSLLQALLRLVNPTSGIILIDDLPTCNIPLQTLRTKLALVQQDSTLFLGTLRENIDPMKTKTDAELMEVLRRCWIVPRSKEAKEDVPGSDFPAETQGGQNVEGQDDVVEAKYRLDATVGDEGSNYSAGEKQLLALARALVKGSKVIVLDEATSSVDIETDSKLQQTIQTEFSGSTLLCIAHRLNTIAYYDRVIVMDKGCVAEHDTVLDLYDKEDSIFRGLCNEARLTRGDIVRIRAQAGVTV